MNKNTTTMNAIMNNTQAFTCLARGFNAPVKPATQKEWQAMRREPWLAQQCAKIERLEAEGTNADIIKGEKAKLWVWTPHCAKFRHNHRATADALKPLQRLMLDFDEKGHTTEIVEKLVNGQVTMDNGDTQQVATLGGLVVLLIEESVRRGTHVLVELPAGMTVEEAQQRVREATGFAPDKAVKDVARCIYMVPEDHTRYVSDRLWGLSPDGLSPLPLPVREGSNYPQGEISHSADACSVDFAPSLTGRAGGESAGSVSSFKGIPYASIIQAYWQRTGGEPVEGERNDRLHKLACHLRYITDNNEALLLDIMPRYGLAAEELRSLIHSACGGKFFSRPKLLQDILTELGDGKQDGEADGATSQQSEPTTNVPTLTSEFSRGMFPSLITLLTSKVDPAYRPAVAMSIFAALDTHLDGVTFSHITGETLEPGCLSLLVAPFSSGKSSVNGPIDAIMRDIKEADRAVRAAERTWREECSRLGSNKNKPPRPTATIQWIQANATSAAFLDLMQRAQGKPLYVRCDEIEFLDRFSGGRNGCATDLLRAAYDHSEWGAERVSSASISGEARLRMNMNVSTTPGTARRYLRRALTDGTLSRLTLSTIDRDPFAGAPQFGCYDEAFYAQLDSAISNLKAASGHIECPECLRLIRQLDEETLRHAALTEDVLLLDLYKRALVSATRRAMTLYIAEGTWTAEIEAFVRWSYLYDIEVKRQYFGDDFLTAREQDNIVRVSRGPSNLLLELPKLFTRQHLIELRLRRGMSSDPRRLISTWRSRGYIEDTDTPNTFRKLEF